MKPLDDLLKPGAVTFALIAHDDDCPGASGHPELCVCKPDLRIVDEAGYMAAATKNRAARRAAARQAAKAVAKAAKTKSKGAA